MNASAAVTDALRRTTVLMQQELERSALSTRMLGTSLGLPLVIHYNYSCTEESTQTMAMTSDLYSSFSMLLNASKGLVTSLEKADWLDRLLILLSLSFFLLVVAYIIKKRVIDKGLWLAFWWVRYLPLPRRGGGLSPTSQNALSTLPQMAPASSETLLVSITAMSTTAGIAYSAFSSPYGTFSAPPSTAPSNTIETLTEVVREAQRGSMVEDELEASAHQDL